MQDGKMSILPTTISGFKGPPEDDTGGLVAQGCTDDHLTQQSWDKWLTTQGKS